MTYLLHFPDEAEAQSERPDLFITGEDDNLTLDSGKGMVVTAFAKLAVEPDYDEAGEPVAGTGEPAEIAPGFWILLTSAIEADPLQLPEGVVSISPIYASPMMMPVVAA